MMENGTILVSEATGMSRPAYTRLEYAAIDFMM